MGQRRRILSLGPFGNGGRLASRISNGGGLCFAVDRLFNQFVPAIEFYTILFHLGIHRRLEHFAKEAGESGLFWSSVRVKPNHLTLLQILSANLRE